MKQLLVLVKEPLAFAQAEALLFSQAKSSESHENLLIINSARDLTRLAYTRSIHKVLFSCEPQDLIFKTLKYPWKRVYKTDFAVRVESPSPIGIIEELFPHHSAEPELAGIIGSKLSNPKSNLTNPKTAITFFFIKDKVFASLLLHENKGRFNERKNQFRPAPHPSSLDPRLARAMINMSGVKKGSVVDPFCGSGGILIEAGLLKLNPIGYDIDGAMIERAKKNTAFFKVKAKLQKRDAIAIKEKLPYVVSDLPYGKSTKADDLITLYSRFFALLKAHLQKTAVIGLPDFIDAEPMIKRAGLKIKAFHTIPLNRALKKCIYVLTK